MKIQIINVNQKDIDRFWKKLIFPNDPINECWDYSGQKNIDGYAIFWFNGTGIRGNRFSYVIHNGFVDIGDKLVCHTCDNPVCCNPNHLFLGTNYDNETDKFNKNRQAKGSRNGNSKLVEDDVKEIINLLYLKQISCDDIAEIFNINRTVIFRIRKGIVWKQFTDNYLEQLNITRSDLYR